MTGRQPPDQRTMVIARALTAEERSNVATGLRQLYPIPTDNAFDHLLGAIGRAGGRHSATILAFPDRAHRI